MKDRLPVAQLIHEALDRTGYDAVLLAEFLGERKLANLHKLIEQARSFDRPGIFTLSDFITQLSEFVARQPDEPLAATHPESTDVVKLMSIHQSKGLEFPVVIVPDVGRPRRVMGPADGLHAATWADVQGRRRHDRLRPVHDGRERRRPGRTEPAALRGHDPGRRLPDPLGRRGRARQAAGPWMELIANAVRSDDGSAEMQEESECDERETRASSGPIVDHHRAAADPIEARRSAAAARPDEDRGEGPADGRRRRRADGRDTWRRCRTTPARGGSIRSRV